MVEGSLIPVIAGLIIGIAFVIRFAIIMPSPNTFIPEKHDMTGIFMPIPSEDRNCITFVIDPDPDSC